jgi:hypothetical protein
MTATKLINIFEASRIEGIGVMTQCKHRWEPSNFGIKHRTSNHYIFECKRCGQSIFTLLKEKNT